MKKRHLIALAIAPLCLLAQDGSDPRALLQKMAPWYDYASPTMKPWHITYRYQYFDNDGRLSEEGHFDYWWSTTKVTKAAWTRGSQSQSEWHTADGKILISLRGTPIAGLEHRLNPALLPTFGKMDASPTNRRLTYFRSEYSSQPVDCAGMAKLPDADKRPASLETVWPAYCFSEHEHSLIASHENGTVINAYGEVQEFQNHKFPKQITINYAGTKRVVADLEELRQVDANDVAFTPSSDAKDETPEPGPAQAGPQKPLTVIHRVEPVYPQSARAAGITGTVVVAVTIGIDGKIKDAKVVSSPDVSLSAAALDAVRQWRYEPFMYRGELVEVDTRIRLEFAP